MPEPLSREDLQKLAEDVRALRVSIEKSISYKRAVLRGLLTGVATAIGATMIATLLVLGLIRVLKSVGLSEWYQSSGLQKLLERTIEEPPRDRRTP